MPHHRSSSSSPFLSPPLLIIIIPIIVLLFLFLALPPFLSFTSQLLRPTSVKKSWDSINILFVLFAILCGVFAKRNDEDSASSEEVETVRVTAVGYEKSVERGDGSVSRQWYGLSENKIYDPPPIVRLQSPITTGVSGLRRSSSSYPDLRRESLWETESDRYRYRFFDDFEIDKFRSPEREQILVGNLTPKENVEKIGEDADVKEIQVDTIEIRSSTLQPPQQALKSPTPPPTPPPPPPPPPPAAARPKSRRTYQTVPRKEKMENVNVADNDITMNPSPPPSPPPVPSIQTEWEHKRGRNQRKKSNVKREIAIMWASLSNQKKRKRKQRTTTKVDHIHNEDDISARQPPPPPPPPPPPSVFHSWFKKGVGKNKKIHSVSKPPPPAPPPPPPLTSSKRWSFRKPKIPPPPPPPPATEPLRRRNAGKPPLPTRKSTLNDETLLNSGNQSPLIPTPPPPPPPFKIPEMKFTVRGDFARIRSTNSSRCGSPEPEEDPKPIDNPPEMEMGGTVSCPSPDVNEKAATFIARLKGEWKLEKINSLKAKQNLGLYGPGPLRNYD